MDNETAKPRIPKARNRLHQEPESAIEPDFDDAGEPEKIQKGMPTRNIKQGLSVVALAALLAFLFWPKPPVQSKPEPVQQQVAPPATNLVDDLVRAKPEPVVELPPPPPPVPSPPLQRDYANTAPPSGKTPEDERKLAALLSSTEGSDVTISRDASKRASAGPESELARIIAGQQAKADQAMADGQAFAQRLLDQASASASQPGPTAQQPQGTHSRFLAQQSASNSFGEATQLNPARNPSAIYEGTIIRTVLTRAIKTDLPGVLTAKVTTDLYDTVTQRVLLVPRGSEITCNYQSDLMVGQELILAACNRLRLPNGKSFSLNAATASDMQGASGLPAEINNHFWKMFKTALIVGAASKLLPTEDQRVTETQGTAGVSTGGTILGTAMNKIIDATLSRNIIIPPTGTVSIGTPFTLTLSRDVELEPYLK